MFAFSGALNRAPGEKRDPALLEYAVSLAAGNNYRLFVIESVVGA
jgi:hypothetical protein